MPNVVYQRAVQRLEEVIPPRLASRSLHEGLGRLGKTPETVDYGDVEKIFKSTVYRHLQLSMPAEEAKKTVEGMLEALAGSQAEEESRSALESQEEALEALRAAIKPFNLYFEWPETQKLRALLQLIAQEQEAGRLAPALLSDARQGLGELEQKLEDQLAHQAGALSELQALYEEVKGLGGPKLRRLETLIRSVEQAQQGRQLASAELERARKLATDLRKLMASSVVLDGDEGEAIRVQIASDDERVVIDRATLSPEISARLLLIDLEAEKHELDMLRKEFGQLIDYQPGFEEVFAAHRETLTTTSLGEVLLSFRRSLEEAKAALMRDLTAEMSSMRARLPDFEGHGLNTQELKVSLHIALGMLETTLPSQADVLYARDLFRLLESQAKDRDWEELSPPEPEPPRGALGRLKAGLSRLRFGRSEDRSGADGVPPRPAEAAPAKRQLEQELARLQTLLTRLQTLILRADAGARAEALRVKLETMIEHATKGGVGETQLASAEREFEAFKESVHEDYRSRLAAFRERAESLDGSELAAVGAAEGELEAGEFPDLEVLDAALRAALERRRAEAIADLHRLEKESKPFRELGDEAVGPLRALLAEARASVEDGGLAPRLEEGWDLLVGIRSRLQARVQTFGRRLDAALARFEPLERLNTDDSTQLRRDLTHLRVQRPNFERLSLSVQSELEVALADIETRLETLQEEFEAVRAISGQLVSGNVLDDLLGAFDLPAPGEVSGKAPGEGERPKREVD